MAQHLRPWLGGRALSRHGLQALGRTRRQHQMRSLLSKGHGCGGTDAFAGTRDEHYLI